LWGEENVHRVLIGKSERMILLSRPRNKWENNTIVGPKVVGWKHVDWIDLA